MSSAAEEKFTQHIKQICSDHYQALEISRDHGEHYDHILFHAGQTQYYHDDDCAIPFRSHAHLNRWQSLGGPEHVLHFSPNKGPVLYRYIPQDFWHELPTNRTNSAGIPVREFEHADAIWQELSSLTNCAYFGNTCSRAEQIGATFEPPILKDALAWFRAYKTEFELEQIEKAIQNTAPGFHRLKEKFPQQLSERELFMEFLQATGSLESELPYGAIIGWDQHAAVLHYSSKSAKQPTVGQNLLIDAGLSHEGYAADITRSFVTQQAPSEWQQLAVGLEALQRRLVHMIRPGQSYVDLHRQAEFGIATLLREAGVLKCDAEQAVSERWVAPFFPHGLGHHLGLQVHDVGGKLLNSSGKKLASPEDAPMLRTTRPLEELQVVTIEPGIYIIAQLLAPFRETHHAAFDWSLIDMLEPCGGLRIEDNVLVTHNSFRDLSHPHMPSLGLPG